MDHPGFELLREAFKKFASSHDGAEITNKAVRSLGAGGKAAVDKATQEFPVAYVKQVVTDFYGMITSQEVADGLSMSVQTFDEEKVTEVLGRVVESLKDDKVAHQIAKSLKDALSKTSTEDLENAFDAALSSRSMSERMVAKMMFEQFKPLLDEMRDASEDDVAEKIKELADTIPVDAIAAQAAAVTREITPERVAKQAHDIVGKLPSPKAVTDVVHGIAGVASDKFGRIADAATLEDAKNIVGEFVSEAANVARDTIANDDVAKKTFRRGKGGGRDAKF